MIQLWNNIVDAGRKIETYQKVHLEEPSLSKSILARNSNAVGCAGNASKSDIKVAISHEWEHRQDNTTEVIRRTANWVGAVTVKYLWG